MAHRLTTQRRSLIESLENRQLLADISVASFGALPNTGADYSSQIQQAINASSPGDTILFPAGVYNLGSSIDPLGGGRVLKGDGAILQPTTDKAAIYFRGSGLTVTGFTFRGQGIYADRPENQMVEGLVVDRNTFQVSGSQKNGIEFSTGLRNSQISNNTFSTQGGNGVYGYYWDNLKISDNTFVKGTEGIHVVDHSDESKDLVIERNRFSQLSRMGIEYQGGGWNTIVQDNYYDTPALSENPEENGDTFAYSIIADRSHNTIIRRNTSIAPERPDGKGVRIVFEVGGDNTLVEDNYSVGGNHVLASNDGDGTTSVLAQNNLWLEYLQDASGNGLSLMNNGPDVTLSWDINRPLPGPDSGLLEAYLSSVPEPATAAVATLAAILSLKRPNRRDERRKANEKIEE